MQNFFFRAISIVLLLPVLSALVFSQVEVPKVVTLMKPQFDGGRPLMQILKDRRSTREFRKDKLPEQVLSNLLWAAFGINRTDSGRRTAPSAMNWQEIDVYVAIAEGLFVYDPKLHALSLVKRGDCRPQTGTQSFVTDAPINLVFVADGARMGSASEQDKVIYSAADTGFISENVYLFCASEGLGTVVRASVDKGVFAKVANLKPEQRVILAQSVGFPKD
jgi:SagB-type dehydrogenase family enzyme